jgi:type 1 glutamine amidotransferase
MQAQHVVSTQRASLQTNFVAWPERRHWPIRVRCPAAWIALPALLVSACGSTENSASHADASSEDERRSSLDSSADAPSERIGVGGQSGEGGQPETGGGAPPDGGGHPEGGRSPDRDGDTRDGDIGVDTSAQDGDAGRPSGDEATADAPAPRDTGLETSIDTDSSTTDGSLVVPDTLVFSRTVAFRHTSIPQGIAALRMLGTQRGWRVTASEDPTLFTDQGLAPFNVVVFLSTTGDVLNPDQQAAFERFIRRGNGFVGIHAATDTEYDWPWYGELVGAYFRAHPEIQPALIHIEAAHPSTMGLPSTWMRTDEWYGFRDNPRSRVTVLLTLDESSYMPGASTMGGDHPIAWYHAHDGGRAFYTALGHTEASYAEPLLLQHLAGGIEWAARR